MSLSITSFFAPIVAVLLSVAASDGAVLSNVADSDRADLSPIVLSNDTESKAMSDRIRATLISPFSPENRDYPAILRQIDILSDTFPESQESLTMLKTLERWESSGRISKEQYRPFEKKLSALRSAEEKGRTLFAGINQQYERYLSSKDKNVLEKAIKSCQELLDAHDSSNKVKCYALLFLAEAYLEIDDIDQSESYLKNLKQHLMKQDFSGAGPIAWKANNMMADILLKKKGIDGAIAYWSTFTESADLHFEEIAHAYGSIVALLGTSRGKDADQRKMRVLEEFIAKYPNDSSQQLLQAKLSLGYLVMNEDSALSGILTEERLKAYAAKRKSQAEKAEVIFQEALTLAKKAKNTAFEEAFNHALEYVEQTKNPPLPEEPKGNAEMPPKSNKISIAFIVFVNTFLILSIIYLQRKKLVRLIRYFYHS